MAKPESNPTPHPEPTPAKNKFLNRTSTALAGGIVANGQPGYQYTLLRATDYPNPLLKAAKEAQLTEDGWSRCTGGEHAPNAADAEVWHRPQSVCDQEWIADLFAAVRNSAWSAMYAVRARPWLPPEIEEAMLAYHDDKRQHKPTLEQLQDIVAEYAKPHPGGARRAQTWAKTPKGDK